MKKLMLAGVSMLMVSTAWAGRAKPKWCTPETRMLSDNLDDFTKNGKVSAGLEAVAWAYCNPDYKRDNEWGPTDDAYHKLSTRLGLTDDDWADVVEYVTTKTHNLGPTPADQKKPWSKFNAVDQFAGVEHNFVQAGNSMGTADPAYFVDALGTSLTETGRLAWIAWCIGQNNDSRAVIWAMCQGDIDAFDAKKVPGEVRASTGHDGWDRMHIRLTLDEIGPKLKAHAADVKTLIDKDPVYGQMFDIAKKQRTDWKPSADMVALQVAMEDAMVSQSRKASDGCGDKTWKAVLASVSKIPAKAFQLHHKEKEETAIYLHNMNGVVASGLLSAPDSYLAVNAHAMCKDMTNTANEDTLMGLVYSVGSRWSGYRGPRTAAQTQIFLANLQPDDRGARLEYPDVSHSRFWFGDHNGAGAAAAGGYGTVTKVSSKGSKVHLEFQKHKHQEYVSLHCKSTGRIQAIRDNGEIVYEETCADSKLLTTMEGQDPLDVDADTGKAIKVGMVTDIEHGLLLVAWPNEKSDTPALVLGQPVK